MGFIAVILVTRDLAINVSQVMSQCVRLCWPFSLSGSLSSPSGWSGLFQNSVAAAVFWKASPFKRSELNVLPLCSLFVFHVYSIMIWYFHVLWNDYHNKSSYVHSYRYCFLWWELWRSTLSTLQIYHRVLPIVTLLYIFMTYLFYNWTCVPLGHLHPLWPPPQPHLWQPPTCSLSLFFVLFYFSYVNKTIQYFSFSDLFINALKVHSCCQNGKISFFPMADWYFLPLGSYSTSL